MAAYFPLGVGLLWDDLQHMQARGLYWTHVDQQQDANVWCQQVLEAQASDSQVALITLGDSPNDLITLSIFAVTVVCWIFSSQISAALGGSSNLTHWWR